jgi:hypothetical protein
MGGIVGRLGGIGSRVTACYNTGNISSSIAQQAGGLIYIGGITGINMATTSNTVAASYNIGSVTHTGSGSGANVKVGGISGLSDYGSTSNVIITTCYWKEDTATNGIGGKRDSSTTVQTAVASDEGTFKFASGTWPSSTESGWGIGNDSASGQYWKTLGTSGSNSYPQLWFE